MTQTKEIPWSPKLGVWGHEANISPPLKILVVEKP